MGRNAMTDDDKDRRRREFLDAAHRLFRERRDLPPVAEIATLAGLAKGTVYRYFRSKEEIFVALLEDDFVPALRGPFRNPGQIADRPRQGGAVFARNYVRLIATMDDLLPPPPWPTAF